MDKPGAPDGGGGIGSPWTGNSGLGNLGTDDSGSEPSVGATGLFGTVSLPDEPPAWTPVPPVQAAAPPPPAPVAPATALPPAAPPASMPPAAAKPLAEPVVHKVVLGGSTDESPAQLLERIRAVTAERATGERPAAASAAQGSGGFTELLRTLGTETPVPGVKAPAAGPALPNSGFTSLLQTLNAPSKPAPPVAQAPVAPAPVAQRPVDSAPFAPAPFAPGPIAPDPAAWQPVAQQGPPAAAPAFAPPAAPAPAPGGFTELLRMSAPLGSGGAGQNALFDELGLGGPSTGSSPVSSSGSGPAPAANQPGEFTRLFGTFSAAEASAPPAAPPAARASETYTGGGPGSFTRMLSLEQQSAPDVPVYREEPPAAHAGMDYGLTPGSPQAGQPGASQNLDPFFQPPAQPAPVVESTPAAGVGITRLIQMLDAPVRQEAPPMPSAPAPAQGAGPGVWTQTFASLSSAAPPPAPAAPPQSWQPPVAPVTTPQAAPPISAGPSEFTRILDASRMREQAMKGGAPPEPAAPAGGAQPFAPMPQFQMPPFAPPPMPQAPQPPAMGGMKPPQPGGFAPPPMPGGFAAPQMPPVQVPQAPPLKAPPAPAAAKLQQMVPILLVVAIVLLVVVLVTVIFLMKK